MVFILWLLALVTSMSVDTPFGGSDELDAPRRRKGKGRKKACDRACRRAKRKAKWAKRRAKWAKVRAARQLKQCKKAMSKAKKCSDDAACKTTCDGMIAKWNAARKESRDAWKSVKTCTKTKCKTAYKATTKKCGGNRWNKGPHQKCWKAAGKAMWKCRSTCRAAKPKTVLGEFRKKMQEGSKGFIKEAVACMKPCRKMKRKESRKCMDTCWNTYEMKKKAFRAKNKLSFMW